MKWDLNGTWECEFSDGRSIKVQVPGCWDTYIKEKDIADRVRYRKNFKIEELHADRYRLCFGAVSYYCEIFLNGKKIGYHEGLWDSFEIEAGEALKVGENELMLDIWKPGYQGSDRFPLREVLTGFIPDVLCTFGGIWDEVWLETGFSFFVNGHRALADDMGKVEISGELDIRNAGTSIRLKGEILDATGKCVTTIAAMNCDKDKFYVETKIESPVLWEPDHPVLYRYRLELFDGVEKVEITKSFGFRSIESYKTQILLNSKPVYVRGLLHWGYYESISPNPSEKMIREEILKTSAYGFNMMKHCLYIPRESYLELADKMGMLLWVELPLWFLTKTKELEHRIRREIPRLIAQIAGHPSVVMVSLGCELDAVVDSPILEEMYLLAKEKLCVLIRDNSGSGECYDGLAVDHADFSDYHFYGELQNMENLMETFTPDYRRVRPWLFGEFCDSDTLRDLEILRKEKGVERFLWEIQDESENPVCKLKPDFFLGEHEKRMETSGIRREFPLLSTLSLNHSLVHRKTTLEQVRSFQTISGYNVTGMRDVPIATSGIFDDFMHGKFEEGIFLTFNQDVMLIPAWDLTRVWLNADRVMPKERYGFFGGEYYGLHLLVSNYGSKEIKNPSIQYELQLPDKTAVRKGRMTGECVGVGTVAQVCYLSMNLPEVDCAKTYILKVKFQEDGIEITNEWPVFLYPKPVTQNWEIGLYDPLHLFHTVEKLYEHIEEADGRTIRKAYPILLCSILTPEILDYVRNGGNAIYIQRGKGTLPSVPVAFWREGIIRSFAHPMLEGMQYESWMDDLRYFGSATDTAFLVVENSEFTYRKPILRRYDCREWRADDYLVELGCGKGKILATTLRLEGGMGKQPLFLENNRFGRWLLDRALHYLTQT